MSRSTIKRIQDTLESLTASVASLVAKDIVQDQAINSTKAKLLATINTLAPAPIHSLATCPSKLLGMCTLPERMYRLVSRSPVFRPAETSGLYL
jgi:hypothetical protein